MSSSGIGSASGKTTHIPELDGIRGAAALMVVLFHYIVQPLNVNPVGLPANILKYFMSLEAGVDVFFVLSGFLLGGILLDQRASSNCLQVFYLRRFVRIIPSYALLLVFYAITLAWYDSSPRPGMSWLMANPLPLWSYILYLQNFFMAAESSWGTLFLAATWSLAVEEQFYMLLPLLIILTPPRRFPYFLGALIAAAPVLRLVFFLVAPDADLANFVLLPTRWDTLLLGVAAAWVIRNPALITTIRQHPSKVQVCFWLALAMCALLPLLSGGRTSWHVIYGYTWLAITVAILLVFVRVQRAGFIGYCLRMKWLRSFGRISYTVYLFHLPILGICFSVFQNKSPILVTGLDWLTAVAGLAITILLAEFTWRAFEAPFIKLGHSVAYDRLSRHTLSPDGARG